MGAAKNQELEQRDAKRKKKELPGWQVGAVGKEAVGWHDVDHFLISYVVQSVALAGGSAQFKLTADRGAVGLHIFHDSHKAKTAWFSDLHELNDAMYAAGDYYRKIEGEEPLRWD